MVKKALFTIFALIVKAYLMLYNFILWGGTGEFRCFAAHLFATTTILAVIAAARMLVSYILGGAIEIPNLIFGIAAMTVFPAIFACIARLTKFFW